MYPTIFTASGIEREKFVLDGIKSDTENGEYVANNIIVFVNYTEKKVGQPDYE